LPEQGAGGEVDGALPHDRVEVNPAGSEGRFARLGSVQERSQPDSARGWATAPRLAPEREARVLEGAAYATRFFMGEADVQRALEKLTGHLEDQGIPYAIVGALALNEYG
jgi:hypothetical protein